MKLEEAIERLEIAKEGFPVSDAENYSKALELGLEALKRILREREIEKDPGWGHLPGETND